MIIPPVPLFSGVEKKIKPIEDFKRIFKPIINFTLGNWGVERFSPLG